MPTTSEHDARLAALLRTEVGRFRAAHRARVFPVLVSVGQPDGQRSSQILEPAREYDAALRVELVSRLLEDASVGAAYCWLSRPGVPDLHDLDAEWYAAARLAFGSHGCALLGCFAVTRTGWLDVVTGERRTWKRLRLR